MARTVIALVCLVLGLSYVVQARLWIALVLEAAERPHRLLVPALALLASGLALIAGRGAEAVARPGLVGIVGWILALKGGVLLMVPQAVRWVGARREAALLLWIRGSGIALAAAGAWFLRA